MINFNSDSSALLAVVAPTTVTAATVEITTTDVAQLLLEVVTFTDWYDEIHSVGKYQDVKDKQIVKVGW